MKKFYLFVSAALFSTASMAEDAVEFAKFNIAGQFTYNETTYTMSVPVDFISKKTSGLARNVYALPQENKKHNGGSEQNLSTPGFEGPGYKVTCEGIMGPGIRGWIGKKPMLDCTWKAGNGSSAPTGAFKSVLVRNDAPEAVTPPSFKSIKLGQKKLKGAIEHEDQLYPLELAVDEVDYRTGSSHSIFVFPKGVKKALNEQLSGVKIQYCYDNNGRYDANVRGTANKSPKLYCQYKVKGSNKDVNNFGVVTLN